MEGVVGGKFHQAGGEALGRVVVVVVGQIWRTEFLKQDLCAME